MQKHLDSAKRPQKSRVAHKKTRIKLRKNYKKFVSRIKRYKGVTSILISVRGDVYDTTLENEEVAEYINYKFGAIGTRARRDIRDIDPLDDIKCIRITTLFYEAVIGIGGKPDREFMIFVTQKTPDSIQRPVRKPKMTGVYTKQTDEVREKRGRKNPVKDLQKKIFGITTEEAKYQIQMQQLNETRAVKLAQIESDRKYQKRLKNLAHITQKVLEDTTPVRTQISSAGQWKKKLKEKKQLALPGAETKLPELPHREAVFDLGYFRPRHSRRISIYDKEGYKLRGDVKIGFKPQEDEGMFPWKKITRRQYRSRGVFERKRESTKHEAPTKEVLVKQPSEPLKETDEEYLETDI